MFFPFQARDDWKKACEELNEETKAAIQNMRFYKFYHVDSPNLPDLSNLKGELSHALGGVKASSCLLGVPLGHNSSFLQGPAFAPPRIREAIWCGSTNSSTEAGKDLKDPRILTDVGDVPVQEIRDCDVDDDRRMNVISESVKLVMEEEKLKQVVDTTGDAMTQEEILLDVLGPRSGYIRGKGTALRFYAKGVKQLATQKIVEQQHGILKEQHQEIQDLKKKKEESHERQQRELEEYKAEQKRAMEAFKKELLESVANRDVDE